MKLTISVEPAKVIPREIVNFSEWKFCGEEGDTDEKVAATYETSLRRSFLNWPSGDMDPRLGSAVL